MDKTLRIFDSNLDADLADFDEIASLSDDERLNIALEIMFPIYEATKGFERVYRVVDFKESGVCDRWGLGI
jgi:hypothetical protein